MSLYYVINILDIKILKLALDVVNQNNFYHTSLSITAQVYDAL